MGNSSVTLVRTTHSRHRNTQQRADESSTIRGSEGSRGVGTTSSDELVRELKNKECATTSDELIPAHEGR
jgi:hypothetical protein